LIGYQVLYGDGLHSPEGRRSEGCHGNVLIRPWQMREKPLLEWRIDMRLRGVANAQLAILGALNKTGRA